MRWRDRRHCPHIHVRGIWGDEINATPGGRRLQCLDCGRLLDGPVLIAMVRSGEAELIDAKQRGQDMNQTTNHERRD